MRSQLGRCCARHTVVAALLVRFECLHFSADITVHVTSVSGVLCVLAKWIVHTKVQAVLPTLFAASCLRSCLRLRLPSTTAIATTIATITAALR